MCVCVYVCVCRWQRQGAEENAIERVQLKSSPTHLKEEEREEEVREHENTFTATNAGKNRYIFSLSYLLFLKVWLITAWIFLNIHSIFNCRQVEIIAQAPISC